MGNFDLRKYLKENRLNEEEVDMKGETCESCGEGTYKETEQLDNLRGTLHCDNCNEKIMRYR
jgi:hypothetical protein